MSVSGLSILQFQVLINRPPANGTIVSIPSKGVSLETNFTLGMRYWVDPESDLPLTYSYSASGLALQQGTRATRIYVSRGPPLFGRTTRS